MEIFIKFFLGPKKLFRLFEFPLALLWIVVYLNGLCWFAGLGGNDGWGYYANLESLIDDHDYVVANNAHAWAPDGHPYGLVTRDHNAARLGGASIYYPWGHSLVYAIPFIVGGWVADTFDYEIDTSNLPQDNLYRHQNTKLLTRVVALVLWSQILSCVLVGVLYFLCRRLGASPWGALAVTLVAWLGSPLPFYANNATSHVSSCLFIACLFFAYTSRDPKPAAFGLFAGLAALIRANNALLVLPALLMGWQKGRWLGVFQAAVCFGLVFSFNLVNWYLITGHPLDPGYDFNRGELVEIMPFWNVTFDLRGGYFSWFPASFFAFLFLLVRFRKNRQEFLWPMVALIYFSMIAFRHEFHGAGGYGPRYLCPLAIAFVPGYLELWRRSWGRVVIFVSLAWSTSLYILYSAKIVSIEPITQEPGRSLNNFFVIFDLPLSEWLSSIVQGSWTLPYLIERPYYFVLALLPVLVVAHISFWWSRKR